MKSIITGIRALITAVTLTVTLTAAVFTVPRVFGYRPYIVSSGSMEPTIHTGAVVFIDTKDTDCETDDVIAYQMETADITVTHRICGIDRGTGDFITKGDANPMEDLTPVRREQIIGTCGFQIPMAGFLMAGLDRKLLVVVAGWLVFLNVLSTVLERIL